MNEEEYLAYKSRYGQNEYNFPLELMKDASDLLTFVANGNDTNGDYANGAVLVVTENQYILSFNRGMGQGPHDSTFARIASLMSDQKELSFFNAKSYCLKLEKYFIHARFYSEKESERSPLKNILSISFNRGDKITEKEYNSFMEFLKEYEFVLKRYNFDTSFKGKTMPLEVVKEKLKTMIDPTLELDINEFKDEKIIGFKTNDENKNMLL